MAVKIDRETFAISALVGAMMLYFFTRKAESPEEIEARDRREEANELVGAVQTVADRFDGLQNSLEKTEFIFHWTVGLTMN